MRNRLTAALVATVAFAAPALAQTGTSGTTGTAAPGASAPMTTMGAGQPSTATTGAAAATSGRFVTSLGMGEWRSSKLVGLPVRSTDGTKIGDVKDVILDRSGGAKAVVIGVGGFLGMGEKNVAVPFAALDWSQGDSRSTSSVGQSGAAPGAAGPSSTASVAGPDHAVLTMTKDDLSNAPAFDADAARR